MQPNEFLNINGVLLPNYQNLTLEYHTYKTNTKANKTQSRHFGHECTPRHGASFKQKPDFQA